MYDLKSRLIHRYHCVEDFTYDARNHEKPYYDQGHLSQRDTVLPLWMFELDAEQKVLRDIQIENCAYADWAKEAHDKRVADVADLRNLFLESDYDWQATKEKNQNTEQN